MLEIEYAVKVKAEVPLGTVSLKNFVKAFRNAIGKLWWWGGRL